MIEGEPNARPWVLSPGCLIDRLLDHIEKLSSFVVASGRPTPQLQALAECSLCASASHQTAEVTAAAYERRFVP
jgi:hypothetical protein